MDEAGKISKVSVIGCWYKGDMYSHHFRGLISGAGREGGPDVKLVTSNCNCFSSAQRFGIAREELLDDNCSVVKLPFAPLEPNRKYGALKYHLVRHSRLNYFLEAARGVSFYLRSRDADVIHFDQVLRAFGILSFAVLVALARLTGRKVLITVHELDPLQVKYKSLTRLYNFAERVIVFSGEFKDELESLGVQGEKVMVMPYAVTMGPVGDYERDGFIYFGGHNLLKGKGFYTLLDALEALRRQGRKTRVVVYTGHGCNGLEEGKLAVAEKGLEGCVEWSDFLYGAALAERYQKSIGCLIPYTGGSGRHPATSAMANATPVIATRKAALPEYLGGLGVYISEGSAEELAEAMAYLIDHRDEAASMGANLRKRAEELYSSDNVSKRLLAIYQEVGER